MMLKQLSVFLENKPGRLGHPCQALASAGINILTLSLADTEQFGILRLIVREWQAAKDVLVKAGCVVNVTPDDFTFDQLMLVPSQCEPSIPSGRCASARPGPASIAKPRANTATPISESRFIVLRIESYATAKASGGQLVTSVQCR